MTKPKKRNFNTLKKTLNHNKIQERLILHKIVKKIREKKFPNFCHEQTKLLIRALKYENLLF